MSFVTNIILHCSNAEEYYERKGLRHYEPVEVINAWLTHPDRNHGRLEHMNPHAGGHQVFTGAVFMGAFNYLELEAFVEQVIRAPWTYPGTVQLFVKTDENKLFKAYDLNRERKRLGQAASVQV